MNPPSAEIQPIELLGGLRPSGDVLASLREAIRRVATGRPTWEYFDRRVKTHNEAVGLPVGRPLPRSDGAAALSRQLKLAGSQRRRMIYVHVPFCRQICSFCAFFRQPCTPQDIAPYISALIRQILRFARSIVGSTGEIDAVYFGGGTPTILSSYQLSEILCAIRTGFHLTADCEVTVESRIDGVDRVYFRALADAGVNRISFGVQSFNSGVRRHLGRIAEQDQVLRALSEAASSGIESVAADLIYNLPKQTFEVWQSDLDLLARSPATGVSVYSLIPFKRSVLAQRMAEGKEPPFGGIDTEYQYYRMADDCLSSRPGWERCSPVHYGKIGVETNRYNSRRAAPIDIFGFGAGGGGRIGEILYMNPVHVGHYIEDQQEGCDRHLFAVEMSPMYPEAMKCFSLTDTLSLDENDIPESVPTVKEVIVEFEELGLARKCDTAWELTGGGRFWAYNLSAAIAEAIRSDLTAAEDKEAIYV